MRICNLKLPDYFRGASAVLYIRVGIGMIALLFILNLILLTLLITQTRSSGTALRTLQEANRSLLLLQESLDKSDLQKVSVHLADARRQIAAALPPEPIAPAAKTVVEAKAQPEQPAVPQKPASVLVKPPVVALNPPAVPEKTIPLLIPAGEIPAPLGWAVAGEYALICEKESRRLHLFKFQDERFSFVKSYPCIIGANGTNKRKAGDSATPKGSYFTLRYTPGSALQEIYGEGAFVLNYPNFLDRKENKDGGGIWIHGHIPGKVLGTGDLLSTKGCIAISNDNIRELKNLLYPNGASISIVDKITFVKENIRKESLQEVRAFMDSWRQAWESGDTAKYLHYFSRDFTNSEGMDFAAFRRHKERVNSGKKFIRVKVEQTAVVFPQEREREMATVRFAQHYTSNNFDSRSKKLFYLKKGQEGWKIFGESAF
jgi:murein L,D-transpeptidase YafK